MPAVGVEEVADGGDSLAFENHGAGKAWGDFGGAALERVGLGGFESGLFAAVGFLAGDAWGCDGDGVAGHEGGLTIED